MTSNSLTENEEHGIPPQDHFWIEYLLFFRPQYVWFPVQL